MAFVAVVFSALKTIVYKRDRTAIAHESNVERARERERAREESGWVREQRRPSNDRSDGGRRSDSDRRKGREVVQRRMTSS